MSTQPRHFASPSLPPLKVEEEIREIGRKGRSARRLAAAKETPTTKRKSAKASASRKAEPGKNLKVSKKTSGKRKQICVDRPQPTLELVEPMVTTEPSSSVAEEFAITTPPALPEIPEPVSLVPVLERPVREPASPENEGPAWYPEPVLEPLQVLESAEMAEVGESPADEFIVVPQETAEPAPVLDFDQVRQSPAFRWKILLEYVARGWRWLYERMKTQQAKKRLRVCETVSLGEKRFIAVIQVDGEQFLVGGSSTSVSTLAHLDRPREFSDVLRHQCEEGGAPA